MNVFIKKKEYKTKVGAKCDFVFILVLEAQTELSQPTGGSSI